MKTLDLQRRKSGIARWTFRLALCVLLYGLAFAQQTPAQAAIVNHSAVFDRLRDTRATERNWKLARDYERQMRYELARQHYLLALASCRSESTQTQLRRELESIDLQIRTMR